MEMWVKFEAGGSDWAGPITASQDDGSTESGWNLQTRCKNANGETAPCAQSRRLEWSLATETSNAAEGDGSGYLGESTEDRLAARPPLLVGLPLT